MTIKLILAVADGGPATEATLETAALAGRRFDAAIDVLHVRADAETMVPVVGEGMSGAMVEQMMSAMAQTIDARAARARAAYQKIFGSAPAPAAWREVTGRETDIIAAAGRLADLVVIGRPDGESGAPLAATLDAALFDTGRPVLVAPPVAPASVGNRIALAWNGSAQAARVVAAAKPFLRQAEQVVVLTVGTIARSATATDLVAYLGRHAIRATHEALPAPGDHSSAGPTLLKYCEERQADLLVMGAYGHSRLREIILGGATRDVLATAKLPLFMAH
jgi:nucleotide-binding universal stress UspA family protein